MYALDEVSRVWHTRFKTNLYNRPRTATSYIVRQYHDKGQGIFDESMSSSQASSIPPPSPPPTVVF